MGTTTSKTVVIIENTKTVDFLMLNQGTSVTYIYTAILYDVLVLGDISKVPSTILDTKSMATIANACLALFKYVDKSLIKSRFDAMMASLAPAILSSQVTIINNVVHAAIQAIAADSSGPSPQPVIFPEINQSYIERTGLGSTDNFNFLVPDYFIQAQNDNKLNYDEFWSYMPNFELAFHKVDKLNPSCDDSSYDSSYNDCKRKKCKCHKHKKKSKHHKHHKNKKTTNLSDLHILCNNLYSVSRLVLLEQISPAEGIVRVNALWNQFKQFEATDPDNTKVVDTEGETGILAMRVKYRLKLSDVILVMSISGTLANNTVTRKKNLYFNVSTVPLSSEFDLEPNPNHAYNKSIAQFDESITFTPQLTLTPYFTPSSASSNSFALSMVLPVIDFPIVFLASGGDNVSGLENCHGGVVLINDSGKIMEIIVKEIGNVTIEIAITPTSGPVKTLQFRNEQTVNTVEQLNAGDRISFRYIYDVEQNPLPIVDFAIIVRDANV